MYAGSKRAKFNTFDEDSTDIKDEQTFTDLEKFEEEN